MRRKIYRGSKEGSIARERRAVPRRVDSFVIILFVRALSLPLVGHYAKRVSLARALRGNGSTKRARRKIVRSCSSANACDTLILSRYRFLVYRYPWMTWWNFGDVSRRRIPVGSLYIIECQAWRILIDDKLGDVRCLTPREVSRSNLIFHCDRVAALWENSEFCMLKFRSILSKKNIPGPVPTRMNHSKWMHRRNGFSSAQGKSLGFSLWWKKN